MQGKEVQLPKVFDRVVYPEWLHKKYAEIERRSNIDAASCSVIKEKIYFINQTTFLANRIQKNKRNKRTRK